MRNACVGITNRRSQETRHYRYEGYKYKLLHVSETDFIRQSEGVYYTDTINALSGINCQLEERNVSGKTTWRQLTSIHMRVSVANEG